MKRVAWCMTILSLFMLSAGTPLVTADPQRGGRNDRKGDDGNRRGGGRGDAGIPRGNRGDSAPGRTPAGRDGDARQAPRTGDADGRGRGGGGGVRVGPGGVDFDFRGRDGFDRRDRDGADRRREFDRRDGRFDDPGRAFDGRRRDGGQIDFNDRFLGGFSIRLGNRNFDIAGRNYRPSYHRHRSYAGFWNFDNWRNNGWGRGWNGGSWGYGGWGDRGNYWRRPFGWGLGAWGLGSLIYRSGYLSYWNPYYGGGDVYNYGQPIPVAYAYQPGDAYDPAEEMLNAAIAAFRQTDYNEALRIIDRAISQFPDDSVLHEFRALVLFAKADYRAAAATIHSVLAIGPGWDWSTMSRLYTDVAVYTAQLRALEFHTKSHADDPAGLFLLAYHYLCTGHPDAAARKLRDVVSLQPDDRVAADLLRMISDGSDGRPAAGAQQPAEPAQPAAEAPAVAVQPGRLTGTWKAERPDGSKFSLQLKADSTFVWQFTHQNVRENFTGTYTLEGNVLALQRQDGGSLVGRIVPQGERGFNFKLLGGPPDDSGLDFARS